MDTKDVAGYYDDFAEEQQSTGINDRIFGLYKRMKKLGLSTRSTLLELGCGVGTMTFLLSKTVTKGHVEAVDISPKSIAFCRQKIKKQNVRFFVDDVVSFSPSVMPIDFITLFDVLEHIPMERHGELFRNLSKLCNEHTWIVINIPNPDYVQYDRENHPEVLQVIDQPLPITFLVENFTKNGLELVCFETYSVWVEDDYQFFVLRKKKAFKEKFLHERRNFLQKARKKIKRVFTGIMHRY